MVKTFGSDIEKVFTGGEPVEAIYAEGVKVWPTTSSGEYYIKWWPKDLSGSFVIGGETRWLQDYSGYYSGPFSSASWHDLSSKVYYIDSSAFQSTGVVAVETNLKAIGQNAFMDCTSLVYFSAPDCVQLGWEDVALPIGYQFNGCTSLREVYFDNLKSVPGFAFEHCENLIYVNMPKCERIVGAAAFLACYSLEYIVLPECVVIAQETFEYCSNLKGVTLPVCHGIGSNVFSHCPSLETLTLGYSGVCSGLGGLNYSASILVPLEWVSEYKSTYSTRASQIYPIPHN